MKKKEIAKKMKKDSFKKKLDNLKLEKASFDNGTWRSKKGESFRQAIDKSKDHDYR